MKQTHSASSMDWLEMNRKLAQARAKLQKTWAPDPERVRQILHRRAIRLARRFEEKPAEAEIEVVEFRIAGEDYAIETGFIGEVFALENMTPLPSAPEYVLGLVNVRGQIVSVLNLPRLFELPKPGPTEGGYVLLLQSAAMEFGIVGEVIAGIRRVPQSQLHPPPPTLPASQEHYIKGVTAGGLIVLDGGRLLGDEQLAVNEQVES